MNKQLQSYKGVMPSLANHVYVHARATIIGDVQIGEDSSIWPGAVIRGDINHIRIGCRSNIQDLSVLHVNHRSTVEPMGSPLIVGDNVTIGHMVILHGCTIEDACLIGMGSIVMDKAVLQKHVLLGAGSLVPEGKLLESGYLYIGRPAKRVRALTEDEITQIMDSAEHYVQTKNQYMAEIRVNPNGC